jgi:hypothetical protein
MSREPGPAAPGGDVIPIRPPPTLLDQVRTAIRTRHYSRRTEDAYVAWRRRFVLHHHKRHPAEMGRPRSRRSSSGSPSGSA